MSNTFSPFSAGSQLVSQPLALARQQAKKFVGKKPVKLFCGVGKGRLGAGNHL
jgi:hypothetical protein